MRVYGFISIVLGFLVALPAYMIFSFVVPEQAVLLAVAVGLLFGVMLYPILILLDRMRNKKYEKFEKNITSPVLYKSAGNFRTVTGVKNGNVYFCCDMVLFVSFETKPPVAEAISYHEIDRWEFELAQISVFLTDGRGYFITVPDVSAVKSVLESNHLINR